MVGAEALGYAAPVTAEDHWQNWHTAYENPHSSLSRRLAVVQRRLGEAIDQAPEGRIRLVSMCAGQGRDVIGVLARHRRRDDVEALLVELDVQLTDDARTMAGRAGLANVEIKVGDASTTSAHGDGVPAHIFLACGVFGNISDADIRATVAHLPHLVTSGATVIWTRHRRDPDLTPAVCDWFADAGFRPVAFDTEKGTAFGVGTHRFEGDPQPFEPDRSLFTFVGDGSAAHL
jgi:hypothetical protein